MEKINNTGETLLTAEDYNKIWYKQTLNYIAFIEKIAYSQR